MNKRLIDSGGDRVIGGDTGMAKGEAFSVDKVVVREVVETEDMVKLNLTRAEAMVLFAVLYRVGGSPEESHRKETEAIVRAVENTYPEIRWGSFEYDRASSLLEGHLIFKDTPNG